MTIQVMGQFPSLSHVRVMLINSPSIHIMAFLFILLNSRHDFRHNSLDSTPTHSRRAFVIFKFPDHFSPIHSIAIVSLIGIDYRRMLF